jgi:drug/metabolite transporter (DMT)-like permease
MLDDTGGGGGDLARAPISAPIHVSADGLALFSGLGACVYLYLAERLRRHMSPLVFYALVLLQLTCYSLAAAYFTDDAPPEILSFDPVRGLFGWVWPALPGRLFAQLWLAVVVDFAGNVGLIAVMKYVPALVVAAACLLGPLVAMLEGVILGVESVPGVWTLVGGGFTIAGAGIIAMQAQRETKVYDLGLHELRRKRTT